MTAAVFPLSLPIKLHREIKALATLSGLSEADVLCQSIRLGSPQLRARLTADQGRVTNVDPLPAATLRRLYRRREPELATAEASGAAAQRRAAKGYSPDEA